MSFTPQELAEMAAADTEIEASFRLEQVDLDRSRELDKLARFEQLEPEKRKKAARHKAWYEVNREKVAAQQKVWYEANREKVAARQKAWYEANREKVAAQQKAYREANRARYNAYMRQYRRRNKKHGAEEREIRPAP